MRRLQPRWRAHKPVPIEISLPLILPLSRHLSSWTVIKSCLATINFLPKASLLMGRCNEVRVVQVSSIFCRNRYHQQSSTPLPTNHQCDSLFFAARNWPLSCSYIMYQIHTLICWRTFESCFSVPWHHSVGPWWVRWKLKGAAAEVLHRNTATKQPIFQVCSRSSAISLSGPDSVFRLFVSRTDFITALIFSSKEWLRKAMKVEPNIFGAHSSKSPVSQKIRLPRIFWGQSSHEPRLCWHSLGSPYIKFSRPIENQTVAWRPPFDWPKWTGTYQALKLL